MKKVCVSGRKFFASFIVLMFIAKLAFAGEIDLLVQKLVEKGVLSPGEAQQIVTETKEEMKKEIAQAKSEALPQWVQTMKLKGDFRLRYQYDHAKSLAASNQSPRNDQQRARIRARLGIESKVNDKLKAGIGIATGTTTDPRSTNITLGSSSTKKSVVLDYAYAQYSPLPWATFVGGKFQNPLWEPSDLIWDTDITPEGGAAKLAYDLNPNTQLFANTGVLIIGEASGDEADPTMYVVQTGLKQKITETVSLKGAVSYYGTTGLKGKTLVGTSGTNSLSGTGLSYEYINITPAIELGIKEPFKQLGVNIPYLAFFGEYVNNVAEDVTENSGYIAGFKLGAEKLEKWGDWQTKYSYAMLEKDAVLDILPDSDRYGGKTGMRSHEFGIDWGLGKNTWLGVDYYYGWQLPGNFSQKQTKPATVLQVDWNLKF
ncbi:MAG: putative porin [Candidatus Omnitrophota bacterium]|jgi:polyhydroxyalkanoate synthesis regulator phasin